MLRRVNERILFEEPREPEQGSIKCPDRTFYSFEFFPARPKNLWVKNELFIEKMS